MIHIDYSKAQYKKNSYHLITKLLLFDYYIIMANVQNIVAVLGEYTNKDWEVKKQYKTIGKLITKDDWNVAVKMDCIPVERNWRANVYDITRRENNGWWNDNDDDVPF